MSGIFDRLAGLFGGGQRETPVSSASDAGAEAIVGRICEEIIGATGEQYLSTIKLALSPRWEALRDEPEALQAEVAVAAATPHVFRGAYTSDRWRAQMTRSAVASQLLRRKLPFTEAQLAWLMENWGKQQHTLEYGMPGLAVLGAVERLLDGRRAEGRLRAALETVHRRAAAGWGHQPNKFETGVATRIDLLLDPAKAGPAQLPQGAFAASLGGWLDGEGEAWRVLLAYAASAGDKSKPAAKWLAEARPLLDAVGREPVAGKLIEWMDATTPDPARIDLSLDIVKGLIWLAIEMDHERLAGPVGRFGEKCFRKVPSVGPRSVKLANACVWALSGMTRAPAAAAELFRLRTKLKMPSALKTIDAAVERYAKETGTSVAALEDGSLPDFGLDAEGRVRLALGEVSAEIALHADEVTLHWTGPGGKPLKSPPAAVQREHKEALAALKQQVKDIEAARAAQAMRLEQSWEEERSWPAAAWRVTFAHPLRRPIAEALVWQVESDGRSFAVMPAGDGFVSADGKSADVPDDAVIRLWHPLHGTPEEVLAWRARIVELELTQPIKQAHREIYVLTDAERRTDVYSNRFAAHILRQHQFRALCQARGWRFEFLGGWDSWGMPSRMLPAHGLMVEYHVEAVDNDQRSEASYIPLHIATDQVRFVGSDNRPVPLETVPPILFSECLRDIDLFVAVTSVANDPAWADGGPEGRHAGYWSQWAFGDLSQTAETRRALIATLAPRLAIAPRLEVTDKFLIVQGKRQKYAIHFGSSNIQILPSNRYLCIVPSSAQRRDGEIRLPFAGDNMLSIILSKAFLLTDEDQITDPTILRQL